MHREYSKAVEKYRVDIRRKHLDILFAEQRAKINQQQQNNCIEELRSKLVTLQQKTQCIHQYAVKMQGEVDYSWKNLLTDLYYLSKVYEHQHELWVSSGVLKSIVSLYKSYVQSLGNPVIKELIVIGSNILSDIFYMNSSQRPEVIKNLLSYQFIDHFVIIIKSQHCLEHTRLLARILFSVPELRQYLYKLGCLDNAIQRLQVLNSEGEEAQLNYHVVYGFVKIHEIDQNTSLNPRKGCVDKIIDYLAMKINGVDNNSILELIFKTLYEICRLNKPQIFKKLTSCRSITLFAIKLLCQHPHQPVALIAGRYLSQLLYSKDPMHIEAVFDCGIVAKIYDAYLNNRREQSIPIYLSILANLTADSNAYQNLLLCHPIFENLIMDRASNSLNANVRKEALYCLSNFVYDKTYDKIEMILQKYKILDIMVENITMTDTHPDTIRDILKVWKSMVEDCARDQSVQQNAVYIALVHYYRITDFLMEMEGEAQTDIEQFVDFINDYGNSEDIE